jgi:hypothetical protein
LKTKVLYKVSPFSLAMEPMRARDGTLFLKGHWGLKNFLIAKNPRGVPGEATLYTAVKVPIGSMPSICFFPDVAA